MPLEKTENFESGTGIGVRGVVGGRKLALGNTVLMQTEGVSTDVLTKDADGLRSGRQRHAWRSTARSRESWPCQTR